MAARKPGERPAWLGEDLAVQLLVPVQYKVGEEPHQFGKIQLRRFCGEDLIVWDEHAAPTGKLLTVLANMTGKARAILLKLDGVDCSRLETALDYLREVDPAGRLIETRDAGERPAWLGADNGYELLEPIGDLVRLQLRRLTAAELLVLEEPIAHATKVAKIAALMTGHARELVLRMDSADFDRVDMVLGHFLEPGSVTGATS